MDSTRFMWLGQIDCVALMVTISFFIAWRDGCGRLSSLLCYDSSDVDVGYVRFVVF